MSYVTPAQLKSGLQGAKDYADSKGAGFTKSYIVGTTAFAPDWLSDTAGGTAITPDTESVYVIQNTGTYYGKMYMYNGTSYYSVGGNTQGGGSIVQAYIVGTDPRDSGWLSLAENGVALTPVEGTLYVIQTEGDYYALGYMWNGYEYRIAGEHARIVDKTGSELLTNVHGENTRVVSGGPVFTMVIPRDTTSIVYYLETTGSYYPDLIIGFQDDRTIIDRNTIGGRNYTHTLEITPADWGRTYYVEPRHITSGGSAGFTITRHDVQINKQWTEDVVNPVFVMDNIKASVREQCNFMYASNGLVGEVVAYMSPVVPAHFLACDGAEYNAADYPQLFAVLKEVDQAVRATWGSADWETKFNVPNLQGEFLRGTGTNGHANQGNGAAVGAHQDGTNQNQEVLLYNSTMKRLYYYKGSTEPEITGPAYSDSVIKYPTVQQGYTNLTADSNITDSNVRFTSRPTNTSVYWVIRHEAQPNEAASIHGGSPVGTILPFDGTTAPEGYLICDGSTYPIAAQSELAEHIKAQHGSYNFYGGDGTTTFAVPDLRGEFIRGAGTNSRANQGSGAGVGVHQDGTAHNAVYGEGTNNQFQIQAVDGASWQTGSAQDSLIKHNNHKWMIGSTTTRGLDADSPLYFTSRPTNTSFNYIIKASSFDFRGGEVYSTEERRIGTWIDGKPLYRKSYRASLSALNNTARLWTTIINENNIAFDTVMLDESASFVMYENSTYQTKNILGLSQSTQLDNYMCYQLVKNAANALSVQIGSAGNYSAVTSNDCAFVVTIKYTKTTET